MTPRRVLACGGRSYRNCEAVKFFLDSFQPMSVLIEGGASGADTLARLWAEWNGVPVVTVEAEWTRLGRGAGPIRNQRMIDEQYPDLVVAFPGDSGTADMVSRALRAGIEVFEAPRMPGDPEKRRKQ